MYPVLESLIVVASIICVGTGLFLAAAMGVILKAGWKPAATLSRPMTSKAKAQLRNKLNVLHLVDSTAGSIDYEP